ncbi:LytR C-terminal domain-containing protein [bacterium]|nr:LytR C-terminal domain-containing protein [bacterium]
MASNRRRRSAGAGRSRPSAPPPRKQRKVSASGGSKRPPRKKPSRRPAKKINLKGRLQKIAIGFFFIADAVLIYFFIRHCTVPQTVQEPVAVQEPVREPVPQTIQIEVLNGCGVSGIAATFTDYLRDSGFDVVKTDNYMENGRLRFNVLQTMVIDRRGRMERARQIAAALRLDESRILSEPSDAYLIDATVVLGEDFKTMEIWNILERTYGE